MKQGRALRLKAGVELTFFDHWCGAKDLRCGVKSRNFQPFARPSWSEAR